MPEQPTTTNTNLPTELEATMQKLALVVSLTGLSLMVSGYVVNLFGKMTVMLPGVAVVPLPALMHPLQKPLGLEVMSAGIVLLALLPSARVLLALWLYARQRNLLNVLVALVVFLELLWSMQTGA